jgi:hypothetical protein
MGISVITKLPDKEMRTVNLSEERYGGESSRSASSSVLGQWERPSTEIDDREREDHRRTQMSVGPFYLICLTISTGGYDFPSFISASIVC